jgi:RNA polymerase sigma-70 factor (ECF subfamily)
MSDDRSAHFQEHRPLLFSIAYRMLGSAADAEDIVQDAFIRWQNVETTAVQSQRKYLTTMVARLSMDHLRSARVRRETYVGPWLPEPLVGVSPDDPLAKVALADSLSAAFLVLLERLSPAQRAAFLLREVFGFEYGELAEILDTTAANTRQLVQRAKTHIAAGRPRFRADVTAANDLAKQFLAACSTGDMDALMGMLAPDAVAWADGGGKFAAARRPIRGAHRVARFVASVVHKWMGSGVVQVAPVSGGLGLVFSAGGKLRAVMTIAPSTVRRVGAVFVVVNPDKLGRQPPGF